MSIGQMPIGMVWLVHQRKTGVKTTWRITDISLIRSECDVVSDLYEI